MNFNGVDRWSKKYPDKKKGLKLDAIIFEFCKCLLSYKTPDKFFIHQKKKIGMGPS